MPSPNAAHALGVCSLVCGKVLAAALLEVCCVAEAVVVALAVDSLSDVAVAFAETVIVVGSVAVAAD
jgi:hypothetical protein